MIGLLVFVSIPISYFVKYQVPCYLQYRQYHREILHPLRGQVPDSSSLQILVLFWQELLPTMRKLNSVISKRHMINNVSGFKYLQE